MQNVMANRLMDCVRFRFPTIRIRRWGDLEDRERVVSSFADAILSVFH